MTHTYHVSGMTCKVCEAKVKSALLVVPHVTSVEVSKADAAATIEMDKHISLSDLQKAIGGDESQYKISATQHSEKAELAKSWFSTYKPVLLVFVFITGVSLSAAVTQPVFSWMGWMQYFMAGFFLVFSFFKLLDLKGFAESYAMYDVIAKRWYKWGYLYAFTELLLGIAFLTEFNPMLTNILTLAVMSISIIGVLQSYFSKRTIRCACLGAIFNLPMSTITIAEDLIMMIMSSIMLLQM